MKLKKPTIDGDRACGGMVGRDVGIDFWAKGNSSFILQLK